MQWIGGWGPQRWGMDPQHPTGGWLHGLCWIRTWGLFHEYLGYHFKGMSLETKKQSESSEFIPCEDLPSFWVIPWLAWFLRYENRKLALVPGRKHHCLLPYSYRRGGQHFLKITLCHMLNSVIVPRRACSLDSEITPASFLSFPVAKIRSSWAKHNTQ